MMNKHKTPAAPRGRGQRHGDVKGSAVRAALAYIERNGSPDFTLRQIASELGVTHPSLYNHFASRDALLEAVAIDGFEQLLQIALRVRLSLADPLAACLAYGRAIIEFARRHPALYRLMFGPELIVLKRPGTPLAAATEAPLRLAAELVVQAQGEKRLTTGDPIRIAAGMWATAHGLSLLVIDGRLGVLGPDQSDLLIEETLGAILAGFSSAPRVPNQPVR